MPSPPALTGVTWTCAGAGGGSCSVAAGSGNINTTVDVPVGATVTFSASGTIAPDAVGVLVNTATVTPGPGASDPSSANNTDADSLTPQVDLVITKAGPASVVPGAPLVYTITVTNNGPSNASECRRQRSHADRAGIRLERRRLHDAVPLCSGDAAGRNHTNDHRDLHGADRRVGAGPNREYRGGDHDDDRTPIRRTTRATFETTVNLDADVEVTKSVLPANVLVGDTVVVTVNALNRGPNPASGVEVTDNLPAGLQFVSATTTQGSLRPGDRPVDGWFASGQRDCAARYHRHSYVTRIDHESHRQDRPERARSEHRQRFVLRHDQRRPRCRCVDRQNGRSKQPARRHDRDLHGARGERRAERRDRGDDRRHAAGGPDVRVGDRVAGLVQTPLPACGRSVRSALALAVTQLSRWWRRSIRRARSRTTPPSHRRIRSIRTRSTTTMRRRSMLRPMPTCESRKP